MKQIFESGEPDLFIYFSCRWTVVCHDTRISSVRYTSSLIFTTTVNIKNDWFMSAFAVLVVDRDATPRTLDLTDHGWLHLECKLERQEGENQESNAASRVGILGSRRNVHPTLGFSTCIPSWIGWKPTLEDWTMWAAPPTSSTTGNPSVRPRCFDDNNMAAAKKNNRSSDRFSFLKQSN